MGLTESQPLRPQRDHRASNFGIGIRFFFAPICAQSHSDAMSVKEISVGMFGAGTVGGGAIEIIRRFVHCMQ